MTTSNASPWPEYPLSHFAARHIGPDSEEIAAMLAEIGAANLTTLLAETIPASIVSSKQLGIGKALSEVDALARLRAISEKNVIKRSMIGQGYYDTYLPAVIQRNILENPAWYTAYTPYQAEISQGRLSALLNFQTLVCELTRLDIANASLLDEATACAEGMLLARRAASNKAKAFFIDRDTHPQTLSVLRTRAEALEIPLHIGDPQQDLHPDQVFGALFSYPGSSGEVRDLRPFIAALKASGGRSVVTCDPMALILLEPPGKFDADIAVGSLQRYGMPMGFGGPHASFIATKDAYRRLLPGRIIGVSRDSRGRPALRLALQTREQHIRREKATSNICTAQVLPAVVASMFAVYHGPSGLREIATRIHNLATKLAQGLDALGVEITTTHFFDTITLECTEKAPHFLSKANDLGINLRDYGDGRIGISCDETTREEDVAAIWRCFAESEQAFERVLQSVAQDASFLPSFHRSDAFLRQPVFNTYHSETNFLRYVRQLSDLDLALDRGMIPLGSCTMKLNATTEMIPLTWPKFANVHPFVPSDQARGYHELFALLKAQLCSLSGYDAVCLQPNSGAQGEYAGLITIRAYHRANGDNQRTICLIPASAHGTNPASAQLAGMEVCVVACDNTGNIDLTDLSQKIAQHRGHIAALMITFPSTHGVFDEHVKEICQLIHDEGGQVYLDGANMNAQIGYAYPGDFGADVSHFNLHKTFCVPHGGGGPGMGPIGVKAHLAPYLPGHANKFDGVRISAAEYGSASILPISTLYLLMMGDDGLKRATEIAILNANYIVEKLSNAYPIMYRGINGRTAHECIIDLRPFKDSAGITVDDVAKRLIDFGFHAPTISFPVSGTMMIEPTESEDKTELDRFCGAMIAIRNEISAIEKGSISLAESPLRHAPHTQEDIVDEWQRVYSRREGVRLAQNDCAHPKYWPPVNRIDNAWGDRNLFCSCTTLFGS